ncbi:MAG: PAS domain-containing protein [Gemmatimonadaceae bacterium]|nr:PAS domain-containing protein [Gemmatimonadaceae bacterium]
MPTSHGTTSVGVPTATAHNADAERLFAGPGEMRARCRAVDWARTPLGPVAGWSQSLRTIATTVLGSRNPMFLFWGPEGVQLYNDAYRPSLGESHGADSRHPAALGASAAAFWTEIWDVIGPQIAQVMTGGEATWHEDQLVPIWRNGRLEDVWWTYSYSPVRDDDGSVGGVLVTCQETTRRVVADAEQAQFRLLQQRARQRAEELAALAAGLARAATSAEVAHAAVALGGRAVGASGGALSLLDVDDPAWCTLVAGPGITPDMAATWQRHPSTGPGPGPLAMRTGAPCYHPTRAAYLADSPELAETAERLGIEAHAALPLAVGDGDTRRVLGVLVLFYPTPQSFDGDDDAYLRAVADVVAQALERARLYEAERATRAQAEAGRRLLDQVLDATPDVVAVKTRDGRYVVANAACAAVVGRPAHTIIGRTDDELYSATVAAALRAVDTRVLATGESVTATEWVPSAAVGGAPRAWTAVKAPWRDATGAVIGVVVTARDETARRARERHDQVLVTLEAAIAPHATPEAIVEAAAAVLGRALEAGRVNYSEIDEAAGTLRVPRSYRQDGMPDTAGTYRLDDFALLLPSFRRGEPVVIDDTTRDPRTAPIVAVPAIAALRTCAMLDVPLVKDGALVGVLSVNHLAPRAWTADEVRLVQAVAERTWSATERARAESRLADSFAELEAVYRSAPVGMCLFDRELRYVRINARMAEMNGIPVAAHLGRTFRELLPDVADAAEALARRVLDTGVPQHDVEVRGSTPAAPGVERVWLSQWTPLHDAAGAIVGVHVVGEEVTARHAALAERERLLAAEQRARHRAERLQALTAALSVASSPADVIAAAVAEGGRAVDSRGGGLALLDPGERTFTLVAGPGLTPDIVAGWQRFPNVGTLPGAEAVRSRTPCYSPTRATYVARDPSLVAVAERLGIEAEATLPLVIEDGTGPARVLGVLSFLFAEPRAFGPDDDAFLRAVATQCAQALERARLLAAEQAARAAVTERAAVLEGVFASMPDAVYVGDVSGITLANAPALAQLGSDTVAALNRHVATLAEEIRTRDPATGRRLATDEEPFVRALVSGVTVVREVLVRHRATGEDRLLRCSAAPVRDAAGRVIAAVCVNTDLTEQRRLERELFEAAEVMPQLVWITTPDGYHDYYNARWYDYTGMPRPVGGRLGPAADQEGWHWSHYLHPDDHALAESRWAHALATGELYEIEYRFREAATGQYRWFLGRALPLRDGTGRIRRWFGTCTDIHEQRLARDAAERARVEAEAANRAKSDFLASMSHELRTPLNAIQGHVQLIDLELHGPVTPPQREALARVTRAQQHLLGLINDVLNFAKLEAGKVEYDLAPVVLDEVVRDVVPMIEPQLAAKGLVLELAPASASARDDAEATLPSAAPLRVRADREKLGQVLLNLLANAVKFTPATQQRDGTPGRVLLAVGRVAAHPDLVEVRVRDTGIGIPAGCPSLGEPSAREPVVTDPGAQQRWSAVRTAVEVTPAPGRLVGGPTGARLCASTPSPMPACHGCS